jgi:hypothetical protein
MAHRPKKSADARERNLILVASPSDAFPDLSQLLPSASSRHIDPNSNLFQSFRDPERDRPRPEPLVDEGQRYAQECLEYEKFEFDGRARSLVQRMAILGYNWFRERSDSPFLTFCLERMLCVLAKKLLLNRFELLFLEYVLEESKWRYELELLAVLGQEFKPYVHIYESENPQGEVRSLQVYLLFCSYYAKKSLNDNTDALYTHFLRGVSERFRERYQEWAECAGVTKIKINPRLLNGIFRRLTSFEDREKDVFENYNLVVEQVLEISPAYNADKDKKGRKRRKTSPEPQPQPERPEQQLPLPPILPVEDSPPEYETLRFQKKKTSYVSNVDGLDPLAYLNRSS